ncbi:lipoate--protein ligase [Romboutsia sp.]|uniref:lipoate--protein ligase n=1 Tax=Romboutsia sp. TaxID=1965302 RepID=UPI003F2ECF91
MLFIKSPSCNPYFNLALEEYVFEKMPKDEDYFMLWQNDNTIVVGKYQNTIEEVNVNFVKTHDINVVRRLSGGGAVYHDLGNLNFTFITDKKNIKDFDFKFFTLPIVNTLKQLGINVEFNSRNDLAIDNKKFSGNSQYIKEGRVLHHGTLLFNSKLDIVQQALKVKAHKYESKSVKSVRSRVENISTFLEEKITMEEFCDLLLKQIFEGGEIREYKLTEKEMDCIKKNSVDKYSTWEWNYGFSPKYNVKKERRLDCGTMTIYIDVEEGMIKQLSIYGDFFGSNDLLELENKFIGTKINSEELHLRLKEVDINEYINGISEEELIDLILN